VTTSVLRSLPQSRPPDPLSEDDFLDLIATRQPGGPGGEGFDEKTKKKMATEQEANKQAAKELEQREKHRKKMRSLAGQHYTLISLAASVNSIHSSKVDSSTQLWTIGYAPQSLKEICGNKGQVEKLQQ